MTKATQSQKAEQDNSFVLDFQHDRRAVGLNTGAQGAIVEFIDQELVKVRISFWSAGRDEEKGNLCDHPQIEFLLFQARMAWQFQPTPPQAIADLVARDRIIDLLKEEKIEVQIYFVDAEGKQCLYNCQSAGCVDFSKSDDDFYVNRPSFLQG